MPTLIYLALVALCAFSLPSSAMDRSAWLDDLRSAREEHAREVQGWLKLVGLESLQPGNNLAGSAPDCTIHLPAPAPGHLLVLRWQPQGQVLLLPPPGEQRFSSELRVKGQIPALSGGPILITLLSDVITYRTLTLRLIRHGDGYAVRIWDENSAALRQFHGLNWYAPDPRYRVRARFVAYPVPKRLSVANGDGTKLALPSPGYAEFELDGQTLRLEPVQPSPQSKQLLFAFKDATAGHETYGAGRFLFTDLPEDGELMLDFDRAENPACAYNPYTICPLPPRENRLPIAIRAGEKKYHD